jgi:inositol phosphorylceramide mannosyltransferase catalytic subunit
MEIMPSFLKPSVSPDRAPSSPPFIPRILWQTSKNMHQIPAELAACIGMLTAMNPTWEHRLYDDDSQILALTAVCSERFMKAYSRIQPKYGAARADLFRYVMIYLHGGVYMDLKSGTTRPLEEILRPDDRFIISQWDNGPDGMFPTIGTRKTLNVPGGEYEQWFVIAEPGHPFLEAVLERALENIEKFNPFVFGYGGKGVLNVMGPNLYTLAIRSIESSFPNRRICAWKEGLRYTMLDNLNAHQKLDKNHYGNALLSPVTSFGLTGFSLLRFKVLEALYVPIKLFRGWNNKRLEARRERKRQ